MTLLKSNEQIHPCRGIRSRRAYYQCLRLKRLVSQHRQLQPLPQELDNELEVMHVG